MIKCQSNKRPVRMPDNVEKESGKTDIRQLKTFFVKTIGKFKRVESPGKKNFMPSAKAILKKLDNKVCGRLLSLADSFTDRRICGQSLVSYVPSIFRDDEKGVGGTGSQSTHYAILKHIFSHVKITNDDVFLDVGCGKGRVLAFLLKEKCPCQLYGVEHNDQVSRIASEWAKRYDQVHIITGDAFQLDYNQYTILFFGRPFLPVTFQEFINMLESTLSHPITLIYWVDQQSGYMLQNRPGWKMQMWEKVERIHGLKIAPSPQSFSIWVYSPIQQESGGNA